MTASSVSVASMTASASAANSHLGVRVGPVRPVGPAVAAPVERHDAAVPGEVRDLHLPDARMDDRPRRQEQHGRLAVAVALPEDADAVALDVALLVRVAGAGLLASRCDGDAPSERLDELADEQVHLHGVADVRAMARAFERHELAAGCSASAAPCARA